MNCIESGETDRESRFIYRAVIISNSSTIRSQMSKSKLGSYRSRLPAASSRQISSTSVETDRDQ